MGINRQVIGRIELGKSVPSVQQVDLLLEILDVKTFAKSHFKRGIVKTKNRNDKLVREILTNNNLQNFMIHYLAEKIYDEANK